MMKNDYVKEITQSLGKIKFGSSESDITYQTIYYQTLHFSIPQYLNFSNTFDDNSNWS